MNIAQYLPLSQRPKVDETLVTSNWARRAGELLLGIAETLEETSPADWSLPTGRPGFSVGEVARDLAASLTRGRAAKRGLAGVADAAVAARIRDQAVERLTGRPKLSVRELGIVLVAAYDISRALGTFPTVDGTVSGAVAVARAGTAPFAVRTVLRARTLVATDADWRIGFGPELRGTAEAIILFLYGRGAPPS